MSVEAPTRAEIKKLRIDAESGEVEAMNALGVYLGAGNGINQDRGEAIRWSRAAALKGHPQSQHHLGHCYLNGDGVKHDLDAAEGWFRRSAEAGYLRAMVSLAGMLIQRAGGDPADLAEPLALLAQWGRERNRRAAISKMQLSPAWTDLGALKRELLNYWIEEKNQLFRDVVADVEAQRVIQK